MLEALRALTDERPTDDEISRIAKLSPLIWESPANAYGLFRLALIGGRDSIGAALELSNLLLKTEIDWVIGRTNGGLTIHANFTGSDERMQFGETPAIAILICLFVELTRNA